MATQPRSKARASSAQGDFPPTVRESEDAVAKYEPQRPSNLPKGPGGRPPPRSKTNAGRRNSPIFVDPPKLQKALADTGIASRREIESWIVAGRINVNGQVAHVGQRVGPDDRIRVNGKLVQLKFSLRLPRVLVYHKPEGEIVSRDDPSGRPSVFSRLPRLKSGRWIAIGRLDFNSCGLLLFTNDGGIANRMMHPRFAIEREYAVRVLGELSPEQLGHLRRGVELEDGPAHFNRLTEGGGEGANRWYRVSLSEGRNREVRRMFEAVGVTVSRLMRVRYGPVSLSPRLRRGQVMDLTTDEVRKLISLLPSQSQPLRLPVDGAPAEESGQEWVGVDDFGDEDGNGFAEE